MLKQAKLRQATINDLSTIIALLSDDILGAKREDAANYAKYLAAFQEVQQAQNIQLLVAQLGNEIIACCQLIFIPSLGQQGLKRLELENVRVKSSHRRQGVGRWLMEKIILIARQNKCGLIQLSTHKQRIDAQKFYQQVGFINSHEGMKLVIK
jgi:ribosomal protein S18 acetylase RimI-like enzyme